MDEDDDDEVPLEDFDTMIAMLEQLWVDATVNHRMSIEGASYLWKLAFQWINKIMEQKERENNKKRVPQFAHLRRKLLLNSTPDLKIQMGHKNLQTSENLITQPASVAPKKEFNDVRKFRKLFEITSVPISEVFKIHSSICPSHQQYEDGPMEVVLSCDGVSDAKSNSISLDIFSLAFPECASVYPIVVIRSEEKGNVNLISELTKITDQLKLLNAIIKCVLCDNPMRAILRNGKNHAAYYACEYCTSHAIQYQDPQLAKDTEKEKQEHKKRKEKYQEELQQEMNQPGTSNNNLIELIQGRIDRNDRELELFLKKKKKVWSLTNFPLIAC